MIIFALVVLVVFETLCSIHKVWKRLLYFYIIHFLLLTKLLGLLSSTCSFYSNCSLAFSKLAKTYQKTVILLYDTVLCSCQRICVDLVLVENDLVLLFK